MNLSETVEALKSNETFNEAVIDTNERRRLVCVAWFNGPENVNGVEILTGLGFTKTGDHYRKQWPRENDDFVPGQRDLPQIPRGLSFEEYIING